MLHHRKTSPRFGTATVELAVCLPVLILVVFGSLSATTMIFMRTAVVQAAYESIREAVKGDGDVNRALALGNAVLTFRNIQPDSITFDPADVGAQPRGTPITVTVVARSAPNGLFAFGPFANQRIEVQSIMLKE